MRILAIYRLQLTVRPLDLGPANAFVARLHRHHDPVRGHRFSIQVVDQRGKTRGVAITGRPVGRGFKPSEVLEVTRLCTDGSRNACSMLYAASARVGQALGYRKIVTYILETEAGASLRAAGWVDEGPAGGGDCGFTPGRTV